MIFTSGKKNLYIITFLIIFSLIGIFLTTIITSTHGTGLESDSAAYIAGARNIMNGNGVAILYSDKDGTIPLKLWASSNDIEKPLVFHWPPLYPIVLASIGFLGFDVTVVAKFLNILLFGLNIFLISYIVKHYTKSLILTVFTAIIILSSNVLLPLHTSVRAEPLFLFTGFLGLFFLEKYFERKKISLLIIASLLIGLAFLSRYIGISLVSSGIIIILFFSDVSIKKRVMNSFIFAVISCIPTGIWTIRTSIIERGITDRKFIFHPISLGEVKAILSTISGWILIKDIPLIINYAVTGIIIIIFISGLILIKKRKIEDLNKKQFFRIIISLFIFVIFYLFLLVFSRSFFDAKIPVAEDRLLFPVLVSFLIMIVLFIYALLKLFRGNIVIRVTIFAVLLIFTGFNIYAGISWSKNAYENGQGYTQDYFLKSEIIEEINKLPDSKIIYTDATDIIYLFTGRVSYVLPAEIDPYTTEVNENYQSQIKEMFEVIDNKKGVIVNFYGLQRPFLPPMNQLKKEFSLCLLSKKIDGEIYETCSEELELVYLMDYSNFSDYWRPMNQCEFKIEDNNILVKVNGEDPWFESKFPIEFRDDSSLILNISIYSDVEGEIRIFYGRIGKVYTWEDSYSYLIAEGKNEIFFSIPNSDDFEKIRIDPIDKNQDCTIEKIEVYNVK